MVSSGLLSRTTCPPCPPKPGTCRVPSSPRNHPCGRGFPAAREVGRCRPGIRSAESRLRTCQSGPPMLDYLGSQVPAKDQLGEKRVEIRLREPRVTPPQPLPRHRPGEPGEVVHERQPLRGRDAAQGGKLRAERFSRRIPVEASSGVAGGHSSPSSGLCHKRAPRESTPGSEEPGSWAGTGARVGHLARCGWWVRTHSSTARTSCRVSLRISVA